MTRRRTNSPYNTCTTGYIPRSLTMLPSLDSLPAAGTDADEAGVAGTVFPALAAPMTPLPSPSLLQFRRRHICGGTGPPALKRRKWCNPNAEAVDVVTPSSSSSSSSSPLPFSPAFSSFRPIPASKKSLPLLNIIDHDDENDDDDEALQDCTAQNNNGRNTGVLIQCPVPRISLRRRTRSNRYFSSVQDYYLNEFEEAPSPPQPQPPSPCDHADVTNELGRLPLSSSARQELSPARRKRIRVIDATSVPASPSSSSLSPSFPVLAPPSYEDAIENDDDSLLSEKRKDHKEDSVASTAATTMPETLLLSSNNMTIATAPTLQATRSRTRSDDTIGRKYPSTTATPTAQIHKTMRRSISLNVSLSFMNLTAPSSSSLATCLDESFDGDDEDVVETSVLPLPSSSSHQSFGSSLLAPLMLKRPSSLLQLSKSFSSSLSLDHLLASTPGTSSSSSQGGRGNSPTSWSEGGPDHPPPKPRGRSSPFDYLATAMRFPDVAIGLSI